MKCFSFLLLFSFALSAAEYTLRASTQEKVSIGDIVQLKVEGEEVSLNKLKEYEGKRISELLYVISVKKKESDIFLECIISEKEKEEKVEVQDSFKIRDIVFEYKKVDLSKGFDFIQDNFKIFKHKAFKVIAWTLGFLLAAFLFSLLFKKHIARKTKQKRISELKLIIHGEFSRERAELFYKNRREIKEFFSLSEKSEELEELIRENQYKKAWSEDVESRIKACYLDVIGEVKINA